MSLDVVDTIKATFGSLVTETGLKLLGLFLLLQVVSLGASLFLMPSLFGMGAAGALLGIGAQTLLWIASFLVYLGAFRGLERKELDREAFTRNAFRSFLRLTGDYVVISAFVLLAMVLVTVPVSFLVGASGSMAGLTMNPQTLASLSPSLLIGVGLLVAAFVLYPILALVTSLPHIIIDGDRMFEALDRSVMRSKGEKLAMFLALLPVALLHLINLATVLASGLGSTGAGMTAGLGPLLVLVVLGTVTNVATISLLVEYNRRLPG